MTVKPKPKPRKISALDYAKQQADKIKADKRVILQPHKPVPKNPFTTRCKILYNRLQGSDVHGAMQDIAKIVNMSYKTPKDMDYLAIMVAARFDTTIKTLQINHEAGRTSFQVTMNYTDRTQEPLFGYLYPPVIGASFSSSLAQAVMLCYISICTRVGRFL